MMVFLISERRTIIGVKINSRKRNDIAVTNFPSFLCLVVPAENQEGVQQNFAILYFLNLCKVCMSLLI